MDFINELIVSAPMVLAGCLAVGYVVKMWIPDDIVSNKYIPTICFVLGIVLNSLLSGGFTVENAIVGAIAGLASTGLHQAFKELINKDGD